MSSSQSPAETTYYADHADHLETEILGHEKVAAETYRVRLRCPSIARAIIPGQFVMLRLNDRNDPLLGRAFALYDVVRDSQGQADAIDIVYMTLGRMTGLLAEKRVGDRLDIWGPLGNGFRIPSAEHLIVVAGGVGHTPFLALTRAALGRERYAPALYQPPSYQRVTICYGVRRAEQLAGVADFQKAGAEVHVATDDGSQGHHGTAVDLLADCLQAMPPASALPVVVCCGPKVMMHAAARYALDREVPCYLSLETPMACGIGACFSCVVKVRQEDGSWDYRRACVEGPIFDASRLVLD